MNYNTIEKTHSTNSFIKENIDNLPDWYVLRAIEQTSGRGRFDRTWLCEKNKDLAMSIFIPCDEKNLPFLPNLTQIAGISVATVVARFDIDVQIKWANDILVNNRKICGILTEAITFGDKTSVVVGIGLNVNSSRKNQSEIFAASLFDETGKVFDLDNLAKEIAQNLIANIEKLKRDGLSEFIEILNEKLAFKNERKTIIDGNRRISGTIIAIGDGGELLFQTENELVKIVSGEISVSKTPELQMFRRQPPPPKKEHTPQI